MTQMVRFESVKFTDETDQTYPTCQTYLTHSTHSTDSTHPPYSPGPRLCQTRALMREPFDSSDGGRLRRLEALDELLPTLSGVLDVREAIVRVSEITRNVLPHDLLGVPLVEDDGVHARLHAVTGIVMPKVPERIVIPDRRLIEQPWDYFIIDDTLEDPFERHLPPALVG